MPFAPNKNSKELGIDISRKFVYVDEESNGDFEKGDVIVLDKDDFSRWPFFKLANGEKTLIGEIRGACLWEHLDYYQEPNSLTHNLMSVVKKFKDLFVQEPQKTYREVGLTDENDMLTSEGQSVFLAWLLSKHPEFNTEVADKMKEDKK